MGWEEGNNIIFFYLFIYCYVEFLGGRGEQRHISFSSIFNVMALCSIKIFIPSTTCVSIDTSKARLVFLYIDLTLSGPGGAQRPGWPNSQLPIRNLLSYDAQTW